MRLTRWWSSSIWEGLSSGWAKGSLDEVKPFPGKESDLFPSPSSRRKTASKASTRKRASLRRGERDCGIGFSVVFIQPPYTSLSIYSPLILYDKWPGY